MPITDAFGSRNLTCDLDGKPVAVQVTLGKPYPKDDSWACEFEIHCLDVPTLHRSELIFGLDALQALQLALYIIGSFVPTLDGTSNWRWNEKMELGFPTNAL